MKHIIQKFTKPGTLVVDACAVTFAVAKACMLLVKHRRFIGCKEDSSCVNEAILLLILLYARQLLSKASESDGEENVHRSAEVNATLVESIELRKRLGA